METRHPNGLGAQSQAGIQRAEEHLHHCSREALWGRRCIGRSVAPRRARCAGILRRLKLQKQVLVDCRGHSREGDSDYRAGAERFAALVVLVISSSFPYQA